MLIKYTLGAGRWALWCELGVPGEAETQTLSSKSLVGEIEVIYRNKNPMNEGELANAMSRREARGAVSSIGRGQGGPGKVRWSG